MLLAPFRGLLYTPDIDPATVTCPPYDVIDDRDAYLAGSPHNVVRLLLSDDPTYHRARGLLDQWEAEGVLNQDPIPRYYLYRMTYRGAADRERTATGVVGALAVEPLGGRVLPHEETMDDTRADRLNALAATQANLDLIIGLATSPGLAPLLVPQGRPRLTFSAEGISHELFDVTEPSRVAAIGQVVDEGVVAIADGHHRYTTALNYAGDQGGRPGGWDRIMAFLVPAERSGLEVGAIHRLVTRVELPIDRLADAFEVDGVPAADPPVTPGELVLVPGADHAVGPLRLVARPETVAHLPEPWRRASAAVAREALWPLLGAAEGEALYHADRRRLLAQLLDYPAGAVVLTAPIDGRLIAEATDRGLRFPQKSTFFHPKPASGLVIRLLERS